MRWFSFARRGRAAPADFDALYEHYKRPLWHFIRGRGVAEIDAEDVFHEVVLGAASYLADHTADNLDHLIFRIARRKAADYFRKQPDRDQVLPLDALDEAQEPAGTPQTVTATRRLQEAMAGAGLSDVQKEALVLYYLVGYSTPEIARIMDACEMTTKSRLFLAKQKIKRRLAARRVPA